MPEPHTPHSKPAPAGAQRFAEQIPKALAGMAALTTVAYIEGLIYTRSYFSEFGALWILDDVPMAIFFERSMIPLLLLLFVTFLAATGLLDVDSKDQLTASKRFKVSIVAMIYGPWCLIALSALDFMVDAGRYRIPAVVVSAVSVLVLLLLVASGIDYLMVRLRRPDIRLDRSMLYPVLTVILLGLYVVPAQLGRDFGKLDKDPATSTLATVYLRDDFAAYKLLLSVSDRLYVFPTRYDGDTPPIETTSSAKVESIQHKRPSE